MFLRVCLDHHVFVWFWECVWTGVYSLWMLDLLLCSQSVSDDLHSAFFVVVLFWGFFYIFILGFLISPKALAYTSLRAWLHLSVEDVWPPGPAYALLVCWRFTKLTVFFLWKRFKIGSNPHNVTRAWFLFDFFKLCLFFDGVRFMFSLQKIF